MAKFPAPTFNTIPDNDRQIVRVDLDNMEWASRESAMPKDTRNSLSIQHIPNRGSSK